MQVTPPSHFETQPNVRNPSPLHVGPLLEHDRIGPRALRSLPPHPIRADEIKRRTEHRQERPLGHLVAFAITPQERESGRVQAVTSAFSGMHHIQRGGARP